MQKMFNLTKWRGIEEGEVITFADTRPRTVRLEVNAPTEVQLFIGSGDADMDFLALVKGRDVIEFSAEGAFSLTVDGGMCNIYTADGDDISVHAVDPVSFTRIVERRQRNPELEHMMMVMQINVEKRLAQQAEDFQLRLNRERRIAERNARREAAAAAVDGSDEGTSADGSGTADAKPAKDAGASDDGSPSDADGKKPASKPSAASGK